MPTRRPARRRAAAVRLSWEESERLSRLIVVFARAVELYNGKTGTARAWFLVPCPGLGNRSPIEMARTEVGAAEVTDLIGRLEHGV
ncbi:MAG: antitoxin Xre/MbcA/ParS toxin-binding domain-containing protein, partial [Fimbriiglobus sp.]